MIRRIQNGTSFQLFKDFAIPTGYQMCIYMSMEGLNLIRFDYIIQPNVPTDNFIRINLSKLFEKNENLKKKLNLNLKA